MKHSFDGLTESQVLESREKYGSNELSPHEVEGFWDKLKENFKDPIIIILSVALVVILILSIFGLTEWYEALAIGVAVLLATFVSTFSEYRNENSFQKLQEEASQIQNTVFRDGHILQVSVNDIVKGEYVLLQSGDKVPADGYIVDGDLKINQASLTGESDNVHKIKAPSDYSDPDLSSPYSLFRGSVVDDGEAVMVVDEVGDTTFYGKLAKELGFSDGRLSPLQVKLKGLAKLISRFGYIAAVVIAVAFIFNKAVVGNNFDGAQIAEYLGNFEVLVPDILNAIVLSIIIVVAAVPEGLPMMIAIVLSLNMRKLLAEKVLVRKLLGIETAGSLNILFSDKTGTITKGQLEPWLFITSSMTAHKKFGEIPEALRDIVSLAILENTASYYSKEGEIIGGNTSERALVSFVERSQVEKIDSLGSQGVNRVLFNSARKFSATQIELKKSLNGLQEGMLTLVKGAPEVLMNQCVQAYHDDGTTVPISDREGLVRTLDELADTGIRLIALAISKDPIPEDESLPGNATLIGVIGIRDEIRQESKWSIEEVQRAGVQVVMITGDRKGTAAAIAQEVDLLKDADDVVLVSSELNQKSDEEIKKILPNLRVIARALPTDKSRLVRISKSVGKVVGMTGDGVNDSAALKQADVGIAMGSGSEVSKEAGDIVILDDNFYSISNAIRYGRTIFKSIRKFIIFQLTVNVAAVSTAFVGPLVGIDFPLTIIQLLWINIIMDTLAAIAFGGEPALVRYMDEPPVDRDENILTPYMKGSFLISGLFIMGFSIFFLKNEGLREFFVRDGVPDEAVYLTAFFNVFIFMIIFNGFNVRTDKLNLLDHINENKSFVLVMFGILVLQVIFTYIGGNVLRTVGLTLEEWLLIVAMALLIFPVDMARKIIVKAIGVTKTV